MIILVLRSCQKTIPLKVELIYGRYLNLSIADNGCGICTGRFGTNLYSVLRHQAREVGYRVEHLPANNAQAKGKYQGSICSRYGYCFYAELSVLIFCETVNLFKYYEMDLKRIRVTDLIPKAYLLTLHAVKSGITKCFEVSS